MSWIELSYFSSPEHQVLIDRIHDSFRDAEHQSNTTSISGQRKKRKRSSRWSPHVSIAYDNPWPTPIPDEYLLNLIDQYPKLTMDRRITGISLWKTAGTMSDWKLLDRIEFGSIEASYIK